MQTLNEQLSSQELIALEDQYGAHNYKPLDVVLSRGEGVGVGRRRQPLYGLPERLWRRQPGARSSAHPRGADQLAERLPLTSRASRVGLFCRDCAAHRL